MDLRKILKWKNPNKTHNHKVILSIRHFWFHIRYVIS